jgi:hypothetical protein
MDEQIDERISRRSAIRRIGAVGAVAWSTPVLSSMSARAFAEAGTDPPLNCDGVCGAFVVCSSVNPDCICVAIYGGGGLCIPGSTLCAGLDRCADGSCPADQLCAVDTCCGDPVCVPIALSCEAGAGAGAGARASSGAGTVGG